MAKSAPKLLVGAHTSAAGGVYNALLYGSKIGATTIQLFTNNQKTWHNKPIDQETVKKWEEAKASTGITVTMSHDSYLINLGSPDEEILSKSRKAFREELERCHLLKIDYLNFHPGAYTSGNKEDCLETIIQSLLGIAPLANQGSTRLLFETTAGQGTTVGWNFEELGYLVTKTCKHLPVGVCIDTCHIFAAGYDIRTREGWNETLELFDKHIGLEHLYALHLNDSMKPFGSKRDRHASIGEGEIGRECFEVVMTHPKLKDLPKYLETPNFDIWPEEIALLKDFAQGKTHEQGSRAKTHK